MQDLIRLDSTIISTCHFHCTHLSSCLSTVTTATTYEGLSCATHQTDCFMAITTGNTGNILEQEGIVFAVLRIRKLDFLALGHLPGMGSTWRSPDLN